MNLTNKVIEYRKTKSEKILQDIFKELFPKIKEKARYVFYSKFYPRSWYKTCEACKQCDIKTIENCELCVECTCEKGFFNLHKENACEYKDVEHDLVLCILRIIQDFDTTKNFEKYLFSSLWNWRPSFLTKNFRKNIGNKTLEEYDEENITHEDSRTSISMEEIEELCKTKSEMKVIKLLIKNNELNQTEIANTLHVSRQRVSKILKDLKKRLKNKLTQR